MKAEWYCSIRGEERGPLSASELRELAARGELGPSDFVRRGMGATWTTAQHVRGLMFARLDPHDDNEIGALPSLSNGSGPNASVPPNSTVVTTTWRTILAHGLLGFCRQCASAIVYFMTLLRYGFMKIVSSVARAAASAATVRLGHTTFWRGNGDAELRSNVLQLKEELVRLSWTKRFATRLTLLQSYRALGANTLSTSESSSSRQRTHQLTTLLVHWAEQCTQARQTLRDRISSEKELARGSWFVVGMATVLLLIALTAHFLSGSRASRETSPVDIAVSPEIQENRSLPLYSNVPPAKATASVESATVTYWKNVQKILDETANGAKNPKGERAALVATTQKLLNLSVVGVDEPPVQWVLAATRLFREWSATEEYFASPDYFAYSFLQGANGRPFDGIQQFQGARQELNRRLGSLGDQFNETQLLISRKYGVEFSPRGK